MVSLTSHHPTLCVCGLGALSTVRAQQRLTRKSALAVIRSRNQETDGLLFRVEFYQIAET
jgi:hypothetical protein